MLGWKKRHGVRPPTAKPILSSIAIFLISSLMLAGIADPTGISNGISNRVPKPDLRLVGVITASSGTLAALIEDSKTGMQELFSIGHNVFERALLIQINGDSVVLHADGSDFTIYSQTSSRPVLTEPTVQQTFVASIPTVRHNPNSFVSKVENTDGKTILSVLGSNLRQRWPEFPAAVINTLIGPEYASQRRFRRTAAKSSSSQ